MIEALLTGLIASLGAGMVFSAIKSLLNHVKASIKFTINNLEIEISYRDPREALEKIKHEIEVLELTDPQQKFLTADPDGPKHVDSDFDSSKK